MARELVADEQVLDDPADLLLGHEVEAAPPFLEFEEARPAALGRGEEIIVFAEDVAARVHQLEIRHEMRAVEQAVAEVGEGERRQRAAEQAAVVAHGVFAEPPGPVGERRPVDDERTGDVRICGGEDHGRPAALAIADDDRFRRVGMAAADLGDELRLGPHDVGESLGRLGARAEDDEIDGVAVAQRDADLAVGLEAADAGAVPGARIDDHVGALPALHLDPLGREDFEQHLVGRAAQGLAVEDHLVIVDEHRRRAGRLVGRVLVGALAKHVKGEREALRGVGRVALQVVEELPVRLRPGDAALKLGGLRPELLKALAMIPGGALAPPAERERHLLVLMRRPCAVLVKTLDCVRCAVGGSHPRSLACSKGLVPEMPDHRACLQQTRPRGVALV